MHPLAYHCRCVDPWLTQTKKTCPVCKQRVTRTNPEYSESSDSDEEVGPREANEEEEGTSDADSERTPLLRPSNPASPSSSSPPPTYSSTVTSTVATVTTSAQCLQQTPQHDLPLVGYEEYYSPVEDTDEDDEDEEDKTSDNDTTELIGRGAVGV